MAPESDFLHRSKTDTILQNATAAVGILGDVADSSQIPFISSVSVLALNILNLSQSVRSNKQECLQMVDHIQQLLWAIAKVCLDSDTGVLPPATLTNVGNFARTLQKIHTFMTDQLKMGKIKRLLRHGENSQLLNDCKTGLEQALQVQNDVSKMVGWSELRRNDAARHAELLALFSDRISMTVSSDNGSSLGGGISRFGGSSSSLVLLPGQPKIFHGRDAELQAIVHAVLGDSARVAILGSGGIGKTSLATAAIHHSDVVSKFTNRHFVPCDSAPSHDDLCSIVASYLQLEPFQNSPKDICRHLSAAAPTLLVLDNLETPWEPTTSRGHVEEFLSVLTGIPHLSLLITMRGIERPGKVLWSRPFLPPLRPLTEAAARQTFFDIAEDAHDEEAVGELLHLTDLLPLAISLIAHIASFEGVYATLRRWKEESTTLLSEGHDKRSNLDRSIMMSLSSPRILSVPGAQDLLSVMSLLPDGMSYPDLMQIVLPISNTAKCREALIRTSLAYVDHDGRLKVLSPIREFVRNSQPPSPALMRPVRIHLNDILMLWKTFRQVSAPDCIPQITQNLANFRSVLLWDLCKGDGDDLSATIRSVLTLESFVRTTGRRIEDLMRLVPGLLEQCGDHQLHGEYINARFDDFESSNMDMSEAAALEAKGIQEFQLAHDAVGEVQFYNVLGSWYAMHNDLKKGLEYFNRAFLIAKESGDLIGQGKALIHFSDLEWEKGNYSAGQKYAEEARRVMKPTGHMLAAAYAINQEVRCLYPMGNFKPSLELCDDARQILAVCRMQQTPLDNKFKNSKGEIHFLKTEYAEARAIYAEILDALPKKEEPFDYALMQLNLATVDLALGADDQTVRGSLDAARESFTSLGVNFSDPISQCDMILAHLQLRQGCKAEPRRFYEIRLAGNRNSAGVAIECLHQLADPVHAMSDMESTLGYAMVLLAYTRNGKSPLQAHHALRCLGDILQSQGDVDTARNLFTAALHGFTEMGVHRSMADCTARLRDMAQQKEEASTILHQAVKIAGLVL